MACLALSVLRDAAGLFAGPLFGSPLAGPVLRRILRRNLYLSWPEFTVRI